MATKSSTSSTFFASVPDFKDLCSVTLQVEENLSPSASGNRTHSKYVGSQPQIVKCRELIFTEPGILASPSLQQEGHIYVVLQQSVWKSGRLQARCQKMGLQVNRPMRVICAVFQACLAYTIRARLAPLWNKAGNRYMQGRDFLMNSRRIAVVDMELNVTEAEICLALRPLMAKLPQCSLGDFDVCQPVLEQFFLSKSNVVSEYSIDSKWCYVLPSLKQGKVISISHEIPATSPFKTYKDMRRYWKNAYGYRLPESSDGMLYYNIYFPAIGPTLFTYPEFCIRKEEPILHGRVDPAPILDAFLTDLQYKVPSVCGTVFEVTPRAQYTSMGLYPAGKEEANLSRLNLSSTPPPTSVCRIPSRPLTLQGFSDANGYPPTIPSMSRPIATSTRSPTNPLSGTVGDFNCAVSFDGRGSIPQGNSGPRMAYQVDGRFGMHLWYSQQGPAYRNDHGVVPVSLIVSPSSVHHPAVVPDTCFRPVMPEQDLNRHGSLNHTYASLPSDNKTHYDQRIPAMTMMSDNQSHIHTLAPAQPRIIPRFVGQRPRTSHLTSGTTGVNRDDLSPRFAPTFMPAKKANLHPKSQPSTSAFVSANTSPQNASRDWEGTFITRKEPRIMTTNESERRAVTKPSFAPSFSRKDSSRIAKVPSITKKTQQTLDAVVVRTPSSAQQPSKDCSKTAKRKSKDDSVEGPTASKKARAKPKVQEGIDVQSLAINDQLSKVNTITLATWLRDNGIPVKSKDKKADLVLKVARFIHANSTED